MFFFCNSYIFFIYAFNAGYGQELFIRVDKVMTDLQISRPLAYRLIKEWNSELSAMGYTTISGRIPRSFYEKKIYGMSVEKK